jgi:hypothetical protein
MMLEAKAAALAEVQMVLAAKGLTLKDLRGVSKAEDKQTETA